jgi:hypothetical protein
MQKDIAYNDWERKTWEKKRKKIFPSNHRRKPFPQRRHLPSVRIAVPDQKLQLMNHQSLQLPDPIAGPPPETSLA